MAHFDARQAECLVFTFKDGLLSPVAHDLKIRVNTLSIDIDDDTQAIEATFDPTSLQVVCAMNDGVESPNALKGRDTRKIESNIRKDVLHTKRHRQITFRSTAVERDGDQVTIQGTLTLHGVPRPLTVIARQRGDRMVSETELHQPDFGITPYSALLGTLKIKPHVRVQISVPL